MEARNGMIVTLNGYSLNDMSTPLSCFLDEPIDGLGMPPLRNSTGTYSGRDGGYVSAHFYGIRLITLTGTFFAQSAASLETARASLAAACANAPIAMNITTNGGKSYAITCYLDSLDMPIQRSSVSAPFKISLLAPDPTIYDNSAGGVNTVSITPARGGGVTWPLTWPLGWAGGGQPTMVTNSGAIIMYPVITLTGSMTSPIITNVTTGQFISLLGLTTGTTSTVVIDCNPSAHTVLLDGGSVYNYMTTTSQWISLLTGNNSIRLNTSSGSDTVTGTIKWKTGYMAI